jgi:Ca2+-binding RTX toxin-like protein
MGDPRLRALSPPPRAGLAWLTRSRWRLTFSAAAAALVVATYPSATLGATVTMTGQPGDLHFEYGAAAGESNWPTVRVADNQFGTNQIELTQPGASTPLTFQMGDNCDGDTAAEPKIVSCDAAGVTQVVVTLGDGTDGVINSTSLRAQVFGGAGNDTVRGGGGDEQVEGGPGPDDINGGGGNDVVLGATLQDPGAGADSDQLAGGPGDDRLVGGGGADMLQGGDAADNLVGGDGDDTEDGGLGNDALTGGAGDDALGPGPGSSLADADTISGGAGFDTVSYAARMTPVDVSKNGAADDGDVTERDNVGIDVERIDGGFAGDTLSGGPGADELQGGPDDDKLSGGAGSDHLVGGPGRDVVAYSTERDVTVNLDERIGSTLSGDVDKIDEVENVAGGKGDDTLTGATGANVLTGDIGEDYVDGLPGADRLYGGSSADVVVARDSTRNEPVSCGRGKDLAIINRGDDVVRRGANRCEQVDNGRQTKPRPGWVYLDPRCALGARLGLVAMHRLVPLRYSILLASGYRGRRPPTLDTSDCRVRMTATTGRGRRASADVEGAPVTVAQIPGRQVTTVLGLERPGCAAVSSSSASAAARRRHVRVKTRRKRGNNVNVTGKYSSGGSEGTDWTTIERCSSTTTRVRRGRVRVRNRFTGVTRIVRAGETYVASRRR